MTGAQVDLAQHGPSPFIAQSLCVFHRLPVPDTWVVEPPCTVQHGCDQAFNKSKEQKSKGGAMRGGKSSIPLMSTGG